MEKPSPNPSSFTLLISFMEFLFLNKFYSISKFFFQPHLFVCSKSTSSSAERTTVDSEFVKHKVSLSREGEELNGEDVEMVMKKLRVIFDNDGKDMLHKKLGSDEMSVLFQDEEPSVEEVKEAFLVFDENRDGFIDATELQRVLCSLGLKQGSEIYECRKMITAFDENRDGQIDFNEFVKLMEKSFY